MDRTHLYMALFLLPLVDIHNSRGETPWHLPRWRPIFPPILQLISVRPTTVIYTKRRGIVAQEPSLVAVQERQDGKPIPLEIGQAAKDMVGRTAEHVNIARPLQNGVVADCELTQAVLQHCFKQSATQSRLRPMRCMMAIPAGSSSIEKRAIVEATRAAGGRQVHLIYDPFAAALGEGLNICEPYGRMIVDIGGGTTEIAIVSVGRLVHHRTVPIGGDVLDEAIMTLVQRRYDLVIGMKLAERLKIELGSVLPQSTARRQLRIEGTDANARTPRHQEVTAHDVRQAVIDHVHTMITAMREAMSQTPPDLLADIAQDGILLTGGGSLLSGLDGYMRELLGVPVYRAANPLTGTAIGASQVLDDPALYQTLSVSL